MDMATRNSWKTRPHPTEREHFTLALAVTEADVERISRGHVPEEMDDRWFIYFEESWLYFHRSWTGACVFGLQIDRTAAGFSTGDCWVSRNKDEYNSSDVERDKESLTKLFTRYFLGQKR